MEIDILFSEKKYNDINFINNGGWHFTNVKSAENIDFKMRIFYTTWSEESGLDIEQLKKLISEKKLCIIIALIKKM